MKNNTKINELISIKTLDGQDDINNDKHTAYSAEIRLFSCIQQGDVDSLLKQLKGLNSNIVAGKMSDDELMQYKYMAVISITLATRYAIQGGLNERKAYDFSDRVIKTVDKLMSKDDILMCIGVEIIKLTDEVKKNKTQPEFSPHVRKCIKYINENINSKITVSMLSEYCNISADYLSHIFKREMNESLSSYITRQKLEKAKLLLSQNSECGDVYAELGFLSQSHFSTAFRRFCGMTPSEYIRLIKDKG